MKQFILRSYLQAIAVSLVLFNEWMRKENRLAAYFNKKCAPIQPFAFLKSLLESCQILLRGENLMFARKALLFSLLFILSINNFAQTADEEAAKEKVARQTKLLEQILADAKTLRLPENRALIFARVGNAFWQSDEKKARKLFADAISDTINAQTEVESEKINKQYYQALIYGQSPRMDIINLLGSRDAELALEYLASSRPPILAEAVKEPNEDASSMLQQYARAEIAAEQRLLGLAAEQNPQIAVKRVREIMKKGYSYETLNLLKKIYTKDPQTADKLAEELAESLLSVDFAKNYQTSDAAGYFIADMGRQRAKDEKALQIPDELLRRLIITMTDNWLGSKNNQMYGYWNCLTVIERIFPDRAAKIKKKLEQINSQNQNEEVQEYNKLIASETTPEQLVAQAEKFQSSYRNQIYRTAATKFANNGNITQAEKILQTTASDGQSEYYLSQLYLNLSNQFANKGDFEAANNYANQIPDESQRINALINLANTVYQKDKKENQKWAESILNQARELISTPPETQTDFNAATTLAVAYAQFDANESFRLIESILPTFNEIIQANFVLLKFRNYGGFRQSEMQISAGNSLGLYNLDNTLRVLKEKDFERTLQFANSIARPEMRVWYQLQLVDENSLNFMNLPINLPRGINFSRK